MSAPEPAALHDSAAAVAFDEATSPAGVPRPAWRSLTAAISRLSPVELVERQRQADRLVEAEGASYLVDADSDSGRPWRLDPVPLVLGGTDWAELEHGVAQRARVLERMVADINGPRALLRNRVVPPIAAFGAPGYLPGARWMRAEGERWLTMVAVDLVRLRDGRWCVLRDITDAPPGVGYALVNRNVSAQLLPAVVRDAAPLSIVPFLDDMRAALDAVAPRDRTSPRTIVLSAGPGDPTYFEHSYLAAHLGYHLAEPRDLVVREGRVWLRALGGLEPVDVVLRRLGSAATDPLEPTRGSVGVPGLARCARMGGVGLANSIGSGVVASPSLTPFVEAVARALGDELSLPTVRTLWCGSATDREVVLRDLESLVLFDTGRGRAAFGAQLDDAGRAEWRHLIAEQPHCVAAQETVEFATTPVLRDGMLAAGTVVLRMLAVCGRSGVSVMPGGLATVMEPSLPIVSQRTGVVKDVWVLDDRPQRPLPISTRNTRSMPQVDLRESLPTRAAEAMYWLGRSAERSEAMARATAVALAALQSDPPLLTALDGAWRRPVVGALLTLAGTPSAAAAATHADPNIGPDDEFRIAITATLTGPSGLPRSLASVARAATSARQFVSATTWRVLGELDAERARLGTDVANAYDVGVRRRLDTVLVHLSSLAGLFNESTVRGPAWRFLEIGRRVERAFGLLSLFENVIAPADPALRGPLFDYVLGASESLVAYRRRYRSDAVLDALVDLLVLDDANPRALAFQLDQLRTQLALLPSREGSAAIASLIEQASTALVGVSWLPADADHVGSNGRREVVDRFVLATRGPLLHVADQVNVVFFNDPARVRRTLGQGSEIDPERTWDRA